MKRIYKRVICVSLVAISVIGINTIVFQNQNSYAIENISYRDIDEGAEIVKIKELSHSQVQEILNNWYNVNTALSLLRGIFPEAIVLEIYSNSYQQSLASADKGNGFIVKQLQYPNSCTFCGASGNLIFESR